MIKNCMLEFQKQDIHVVSGISKFIRGYDSSSFIIATTLFVHRPHFKILLKYSDNVF